MSQNDREQRFADQPKVKCFGSKAALCAEATFIIKNSAAPVPTINLEVAPRIAESVAWDRKVVTQLSDSELPLVCAVLMGYIPKLHLKRPDKGIELERQANKIFVRASAGAGNLFMLPITIGDTFRLSALMLVQLRKQSGLCDEMLILAR
ncbi:MAG: hypothetical protein JAZ02_20260 [Candidatus Thiodiazotropha endolucinida]|nr:hypothetical protein [Candidatus Thiodiazotropha endolucinida]